MLSNGFVLSKDTIVAEVKAGRRTVVNAALCPLYLLRHDDAEGWLRRRAIDSHRTNSRLLRKALRLAPNDDLEAVLRVHGATVTDTYWFRREGEQLTYSQVRFTGNEFAELALRGDPDSFQRGSAAVGTPELTNTGSFEKCWKLADGAWWMVKAGNELEQFSELFVYELGKEMGLCMTRYEREGQAVRSLDFTRGTLNFEPMYAVLLDEEDYSENYRRIRTLCPRAAAEYVGMVYLDALVLNMDRHTNNYGFLRDQDSGEILSLAPLFDHNIALVSRGYPSQPSRGGDLLQKLFAELLVQEPQAAADFQSLHLKKPDAEMIRQAIQFAGGEPCQQESIREEFLTEFILSGEMWIEKQMPELFRDQNALVLEEPEL